MKRTVKFEYKGQMINYYNKLKENMEKFEYVNYGLDMEIGWYIEYKRK